MNHPVHPMPISKSCQPRTVPRYGYTPWWGTAGSGQVGGLLQWLKETIACPTVRLSHRLSGAGETHWSSAARFNLGLSLHLVHFCITRVLLAHLSSLAWYLIYYICSFLYLLVINPCLTHLGEARVIPVFALPPPSPLPQTHIVPPSLFSARHFVRKDVIRLLFVEKGEGPGGEKTTMRPGGNAYTLQPVQTRAAQLYTCFSSRTTKFSQNVL